MGISCQVNPSLISHLYRLFDPEAVTLKVVPLGAVTFLSDGWDVILGEIQVDADDCATVTVLVIPLPVIVTIPLRVLVVDGFALVEVTVIEPLFEPLAGFTLNQCPDHHWRSSLRLN